MRVLISGFEPFLDEKVNPTEYIAKFVDRLDFKSEMSKRNSRFAYAPQMVLRGIVLPVVFEEAFRRLEAERRSFCPDVVINLGLAGGRSRIEVEMIAVNQIGGDAKDDQSSRGDNKGQTFQGPIICSSPIFEAPVSLETTLPVSQILSSLNEFEIPSGRSWSAGRYVCNDLFYRVQDRLRFTRIRSGFIHVPRFDNTIFTELQFERALLAILSAL